MIPQFNTPWLLITGGDIVLPGGDVLHNGTLMINQGVVQDIVEKPPASLLLGNEDVSIVDASDRWVTPGLIDQHLHGAFGVDFNRSAIPEIHQLLAMLPQYGITGVLPTVMTAPKLEMVVALANLEEVIQTLDRHEARVFGIHLEGPFLNPQFRGAHPPEDLLTPTDQTLEGLLSPSVKRVTLAPELDPSGAMIAHLRQQGILCSIGHSGADYAAATHAIDAGATCATHLYNAMHRIDHRDPGIVVASLLRDELFVEMISDGLHLSPLMVALALRVKPFEKTVVISDCNALTGMVAGTSMQFGKQTITVHPEGALNEEGRLAGSTMLITDCVRNLVYWGLLSFPHAVQLATRHPAVHLGETPLFGQVAVNAMADLVLWKKDDLSIDTVFLAGEPVVSSSETPVGENV